MGCSGPIDKVMYRLKSNDEKCSVIERCLKGRETAVNLAFFCSLNTAVGLRMESQMERTRDEAGK